MPRRHRLQDAGFLHHVISVGNNMQPILRSHADFRQYLEFLDIARKKYPLKIYNFCLIDNHLHLLVEPQEEGALSRAMEEVSKSYAKYFNKKYNHSGHVFQGRFKSFIVEESKYFIACSRYMDMCPVEHKLVYEPKQYQWSGYLALAEGERTPINLDLSNTYANLGATNQERQIAYRALVFNYQGEPLDLLNRRACVLGDREFKKKFKSK